MRVIERMSGWSEVEMWNTGRVVKAGFDLTHVGEMLPCTVILLGVTQL